MMPFLEPSQIPCTGSLRQRKDRHGEAAVERLERLLNSFWHPLAPLPSGGMALAGLLHEVKQVRAPACDS